MQYLIRITDLVPAAKRGEGARATFNTLLKTIDARRQSLAIGNRHRLQTLRRGGRRPHSKVDKVSEDLMQARLRFGRGLLRFRFCRHVLQQPTKTQKTAGGPQTQHPQQCGSFKVTPDSAATHKKAHRHA